MKNCITLSILVLLSLPSFGQKLDYDNDSKWFVGFNVGGTWNTTDVKNKTNLGWGLTLGRAFNYNYGKKFSYDLRLRYLGGNWYGQDYDTTHVFGNSKYSADGPVHQAYDSLGYTINNFNTEAHEVGLEFVIHLNALRERTGLDPYIFGGIGVVWNQTHGDLYSQDELDTLNNSFYQYNAPSMSKQELKGLSDNIYDTPLDGSKDGFSINFVPSVGIGLAYQVGPKFSIGLEHRTMFSMRNTFDGYAGSSTKWGMQNDLYHYSGLSMKFHVGKQRTNTEVVNTNTNTNTNTNGIVNGGCKNPVVTIRNPNQVNSTANQRDYDFEATISEVAGRESIQLFVNGSQSTNFTFDPNTRKLQSRLLLNNGSNEVRVVATNACGTDEERVTINFTDCVVPQVQFIQPAGGSISVAVPTYTVTANVFNSGTVEFQINGVNSTNFTMNGDNFSSTIALRPGANTVRIIVRNECGVAERTATITYSNCAVPVVTLLSGTGTLRVTEPLYNIRADIANVTAKENMQFSVNGANKDFTYNVGTHAMKGSATLLPGFNTLIVTATNDCGTHSATVTVEYVPCVAPEVTIIDPAGGNITVNEANYQVRAQMANVTNVNQIQLKVNGVLRTGGSYNASTKIFSQNLTLGEGLNTVEIVATTDCGAKSAIARITKRACVGPQITLGQPAVTVSTVQSNVLPFSASIFNVTGINQIQLFVNGVVQAAGTYNATTKLFSKSVTLNTGTNTVKLVATNDCSSQEVTYTVSYSPCTAPTVTMVAPTAIVSTENATYLIQAIVANVTNVSQIQLKVNGNTIAGGSYNPTSGLFEMNLMLTAGNNVFQVTATNECGTDNKRGSIKYTPCIAPTIAMITPMGSDVSTASGTYQVQATIQNVTNIAQITLTINGVQQGGGTYNAANGLYSNTISVSNLANTVVITATSECGTVNKSFILRHTPCLAPTITMVTPTASNVSTEDGTLQVRATIQNVTGVSQISLTINGVQQGGGTYNAASGLYSNNITVTNAMNTVVITATTDCGTVSKSFIVRHAPCASPTITMVTPTGTDVSTENGSLQVRATIQNVTGVSQISLTINGVQQGGGTFNAASGLYSNNITVSNATNTVVITATTDCGTVSKSFIVRHAPCVGPTLAMLAPRGSDVSTANGTLQISATIQNVTGISQISLTINGVQQGGGTYNAANGLYSNLITVTSPTNTVVITVTTDCGTVSKTIVVRHPPCNPPSIAIISPNVLTTTGASVLLQATILNVSNASQITLVVNGAPVTGATFDPASGNFQKTVSLIDGLNTMSIIATTECGTIQKNVEITHGDEQKITICHYPPGNTGNPQQIEIPISAWPAHQAHGDVLGPCPGGDGGNGNGNGNGNGEGGGDGGGNGGEGDGKSGENPGKGGVKPINEKPKEDGAGEGGN